MKVPRTAYANRASVQLFDDEGAPSGHLADEVYVSSFPAYSLLLGPDGEPLEYEDPPPVGFDLTPRT